jgi:pyrroloquinoline quinone biosynthesis protein B
LSAPLRALLRAAFLAAAGAGCASLGQEAAPAPEGPYILVLGTAQDGGLPQIGCREPCCEAARAEPERARRVASLLVVDPQSGGRWLIDASPDLREQVELARGHPASRAELGPRPPLFDGVFLTHAHMGHYTGLVHLGREAYGARDLPVHASPRMRGFLEQNGPWSLLAQLGAIELRTLAIGQPLELAPGLTLTALAVPHRDEFSDTLAFVVRGPRRGVLYLPDIDQWERWEVPLETALAEVDLALLDGTFFDERELPGRDRAEFPHPPISSTLERLAGAGAELRARVLFTHLNHTNPACDPDSEAAQAVRRAGMGVASDGQRIGL